MGTATANLSGNSIYTATISSGATARWSNSQIENKFDHIPPVGAVINSAQVSFEVKRATGAIFKQWSIADEDGSNNATILKSGTSASTRYETRTADLKAAGIAQSAFSPANGIVKFKKGYVRFKCEVKTVSAVFKNCKIVVNWTDVKKTFSVKSSTDGVISTKGGSASIISTNAYNDASVSGSTATLKYYNSNVMVTMKAVANPGYKFVGWADSSGSIFSLNEQAQTFITGNINESNIYWVACFEKIAPPEFTSASLTYAGTQVSAGNKVPAGESCILSVGVT